MYLSVKRINTFRIESIHFATQQSSRSGSNAMQFVAYSESLQ